ncbi:MAG: EAL domain-containing protein [Nitrospinota bacterium]
MERMHSLLKRQLNRHFGNADFVPKEWQKCIEAINEAYWHFDDDRKMIERSLELSSQELLQANSEMQAVFQAFPDLFFRLDVEGTILEYKTESSTDLYLSAGKLLGKRIQDIPLENVRKKFHEAIHQVQEKKSLVSIEYSLMTRDREQFYEARLLPLPENQIIVIVRNITEREHAEEERERYLSLLHATLESTADGILVVDNEGGWSSFNQKFIDMWHIPESIVASRDDDRALVCVLDQLKDPEGFVARVKKLYSQPDAESYDFIEFKDGRIVERYSKPQVIEKKTVGRVWSFRDITKRKQAEEKLRMAAKVFENTTEGIMITDRRGNIQSVNSAFTIITGYSAKEAIGKTVDLLRSETHDSDFYKNIWKTLLKRGYWQGEISSRCKDGKSFPAWLNLNTIRDDKAKAINYVAVFSDITKIKQSEDRLNYLAHHDLLTGMPNRLLFQDRLQQALKQAKRYGKFVGLLFLDLDRFKTINDILGHSIGDLLLQSVAERLKECVRDSDTISRWGGDEFAVILPTLEQAADAAKVAKKILKALSEVFVVKAHEFFVSVSIGIAIHPSNGRDAETLVKNADTAMYHAKERGKNNYQFYTDTLNAKSIGWLALETSLRHALEKEEFLLYYQPQVDLKTGRIIGMEALIRWQQFERLVPPKDFIPLAEETGLIVPMGEWGLRMACRQNKLWQAAGFTPMPVAVNLSARQFQQKDLLETIDRVLKESGLDSKYLELELTESAVMQDAETTIVILQELKARGVKISIDDFGIGYSSLNYLRRFPINKLKIDQSFVQDITTNPEDAAITTAVISLGHNLNMQVIAEGVESREQLIFLHKHHCDKAQGFYFSPPLPVEAFTVFLQQNPCFTWTNSHVRQ